MIFLFDFRIETFCFETSCFYSHLLKEGEWQNNMEIIPKNVCIGVASKRIFSVLVSQSRCTVVAAQQKDANRNTLWYNSWNFLWNFTGCLRTGEGENATNVPANVRMSGMGGDIYCSLCQTQTKKNRAMGGRTTRKLGTGGSENAIRAQPVR